MGVGLGRSSRVAFGLSSIVLWLWERIYLVVRQGGRVFCGGSPM